MKHNYTVLLMALSLMVISSCNDLMEKTPINKISADVFFSSENDLSLFAAGLLDTAYPSAGNIAIGEDTYTDFCGTRSSKNFYWGNYTAASASNWTTSTWSFARRVAYMLDNMPRCKDVVDEDIYNHYEGVARFWRAYIHMARIKTFGDIPFIDHVVQTGDNEFLYAPRDDREYVFHKIREDLDFACEHCLTSGKGIQSAGRAYINQYVALAMASRYFLYEGTYRKYHSVNPSTGKPWSGEYEDADELLQLAASAARKLMDTKAFSLNSNYRDLFVSEKLPENEVIWGRSYAADLEKVHSVSASYCGVGTQSAYSPTKEYVRMFLKSDGTPAKEAVSVTEEFDGRDARLGASVLTPTTQWTLRNGTKATYSPNWVWTMTGYMWIKWIQLNEDSMGAINKSFNSVPILRYGEVLLNYAEAQAELGQMTESIWNETVGALRQRAGVRNIYPGSAGYVADTWLREYYTEDVKHPAELTDVQLEIRRERATELTMEGDSRYDDLMRWCLGDLIERRYHHRGWRGIYLSKSEAQNGFTWGGKKYTVSETRNTSETNYKITGVDNGNWSLSYGSYGYLIYHYDIVWEDRMYTKPIPLDALKDNPALGQNDGWQWL